MIETEEQYQKVQERYQEVLSIIAPINGCNKDTMSDEEKATLQSLLLEAQELDNERKDYLKRMHPKVILVKVDNCNGPVMHLTADSALEEIKELLEEAMFFSESASDDAIHIRFAIKTRGEADEAPEFMGY